jgi:putative endopeptidase
VRAAYLQTITDSLVLAGVPAAQAQARAAKVLAIETRIAGKKLTEEQKRDFNATYSDASLRRVKAALGNFDLDAYFKALGLPTGVDLLVTEVEALKERNAVLGDYPLADIKDYLQWESLRLMSPYLSPAFVDAQAPLTRRADWQAEAPKRETWSPMRSRARHGALLGRLYVDRHFPAPEPCGGRSGGEQRRAEFRQRLEQNTWLTAPTKSYALEKVDKIKIVVGYPDKWIDYSGVDVRRTTTSATRPGSTSSRSVAARWRASARRPRPTRSTIPEHPCPPR